MLPVFSVTEAPVSAPTISLTPVNCSKTQAVTVETRSSQNKEAREEGFPRQTAPEKTRERTQLRAMDRQQQHAKVERFLKLGYSHNDILRVLESLHHDAQTNDILEELIKTCHTRSHGNSSGPNSPKLVPRGCSPGPIKPRTGPDRETIPGFRPVVIDGSNVAMR